MMNVLISLVCINSLVYARDILRENGIYSPEALADQVLDLPGLTDPITFNQFSGYLKVNNTKNLHYWMVESQGNPATDPVAFWTNG